MIITPTQTSGAQFAELRSTGRLVGKQLNTMMNAQYRNAKALMPIP